MERKFHRLIPGLVLLACLTCLPFAARAQDEDADAPEAPAKEAAAPDAAETPVDPKRSPLVGDPKTPDELMDATLLMVEIARLDLAKLYLDNLLAQTLDDDVLVALRDKYGAAAFLQLANVAELKKPAAKLLDLSNAAVIKHAADPARVARLINDLEGDPERQAFAEAELESMGPAIVPGLLSVLNNPDQAARHDSTMQAIMRVGEPAVPLLLGALGAPGEIFRANVITLLGRLHSSAALPYLWFPAISPDEAAPVREAARAALARILRASGGGLERIATEGTVDRMIRTARENFRNESVWKTDDAGKVALWSWGEKQGMVVPRLVTPEDASEITGHRFAREAVALAPQRRDTQVLYLALMLARDIRRNGIDRPVATGPGTAHDLALSAGSDVILDVLAEAFNATRPAVAVAALRIFSQTGTLDQLSMSAGRRSVVVLALDYPDLRVQFAAATAILQLDPPAYFRGAPRVVEILKRALGSGGRPHAVVGEVSAERGARIGGFLRDLGYEAVVVTSGRDAFKAAAGRTDVELIVLHPNIIRWPLSETMANLRADARTASMPIVIHGPGDLRKKMAGHVRAFQLVSFSAVSETTQDFEMQLRPFLKQIKTSPMTAEERAFQKSAAVEWLAYIAQGRRMKVFDISGAEPELIEALDDPKLAPLALEALGEMASRTSQQRIGEIVIDPQAEPNLRRTAAVKLAAHIQRWGLMLSQGAIDGVHKVWESAREPADLRTAVGGVVGSLKPDSALAGKRLKTQAIQAR